MIAEGSMRLINADRFQGGYMRNNKPSGQKNVRCFPCCSVGGHIKQQVSVMYISPVLHQFYLCFFSNPHPPPLSSARRPIVLRPVGDVRSALSDGDGPTARVRDRRLRRHGRRPDAAKATQNSKPNRTDAARPESAMAHRGRRAAGGHPLCMPHEQAGAESVDHGHVPRNGGGQRKGCEGDPRRL